MLDTCRHSRSSTPACSQNRYAIWFAFFVILAAEFVTTTARAKDNKKERDTLSLSFNATLASDYIFRGVSQTLSQPALHLSMDIEHANGVYAYLWASNVDFVEAPDVDDGARWELNTALGYAVEISDSLMADLSLVRYEYPGTVSDIDYDYYEWIVSLYIFENYRLTSGYADNVFGEPASAPFYEVAAEFDLPWGLYTSIEAGYYDLQRAYLDSYRYGSLTIGKHGETMGWTIAHHQTDSHAEDMFGSSIVDPRLVASLSITF